MNNKEFDYTDINLHCFQILKAHFFMTSKLMIITENEKLVARIHQQQKNETKAYLEIETDVYKYITCTVFSRYL